MTRHSFSRERTGTPPQVAVEQGTSQLVLPVAVGLTGIVGATSVTVRPSDQVGFAVIVLAAALLALRAFGSALPPSSGVVVATWATLTVVYSLVTATQVSWSARYFTGDLAVSLLPLLFLLAYVARPGWLSSVRGLVALLAGLLVAALVAPTFGVLGTRHEPPSTLLIAGTWYFALRGTRAVRVCAGVLVPLVGVLVYTSGYRTSLVVWGLAPIVVMASVRGTRSALKIAAALVVAATLLAMTTSLDTSVVQTLRATRFDTMLAGRPDESLDTRFLEAKDVRSTIGDEWLPGQALVGYGYGASYVPDASFIEANVGSNGRVHSIHVGPALVFFRFGLLGLTLCGAALWLTFRVLRDLRRTNRPGPWISRDLVAVSGVGLLLYAVESLMLNATVQPAMSWCLAIVLAAWVWSREPSQQGRRREATSLRPALTERGSGPGRGASTSQLLRCSSPRPRR